MFLRCLSFTRVTYTVTKWTNRPGPVAVKRNFNFSIFHCKVFHTHEIYELSFLKPARYVIRSKGPAGLCVPYRKAKMYRKLQVRYQILFYCRVVSICRCRKIIMFKCHSGKINEDGVDSHSNSDKERCFEDSDTKSVRNWICVWPDNSLTVCQGWNKSEVLRTFSEEERQIILELTPKMPVRVKDGQ